MAFTLDQQLSFMIVENFECLDVFKARPGLVAKNATLGLPAGITKLIEPERLWTNLSQRVSLVYLIEVLFVDF